MANYKDIVGTSVRNNAGALTSAKDGELFYDSTNLDFIYRHQNVTSDGAWRTGGTMNTARRRLAGAGSQTAALAISGTADPPLYAQVESYNGSSWTEIADVNSAREELAAAGTSTAAVAFGGKTGSTTGITEMWDGSSWTEVNDLNTARQELTGDGATNTA